MHILNHTWLQENTCQMRNNWTIALHYRMCTLSCFTNHQQWGCSNDQAPECTAHLGVAVGSTQLASPLRVDISIGIELVWSDHTVDATGTVTVVGMAPGMWMWNFHWFRAVSNDEQVPHCIFQHRHTTELKVIAHISTTEHPWVFYVF